MFELMDIFGMILCILCGLGLLASNFICLRNANKDLKKIEDERNFLSLEYKYQLEKLISELERIIQYKKNE